MDTKINITVYDILSYLFPGVALIIFLKLLFKFEVALSSSMEIIFIVVFGYLIGALLHQLGLLLFTSFYSSNYKKYKILYYFIFILEQLAKLAPLRHPKSKLISIKEELRKIISKEFNIKELDNLSLFVIADSITSSIKDSDRDILLSKEGLFRTLTSLLFVLVLIVIFIDNVNHKIITFAILLAILELMRYSREHFRVLKNQRIYCLAFINLKKKDVK